MIEPGPPPSTPEIEPAARILGFSRRAYAVPNRSDPAVLVLAADPDELAELLAAFRR